MQTLTRRRQQRVLLGYAVVYAIGALLCLFFSEKWAFFGLGLGFPGLGFIDQNFSMFLIGVFLFLLSLIVWLANGNIILPVLVWLGLAVAAGLTVDDDAINKTALLIPPAIILFVWLYRHRKSQKPVQPITPVVLQSAPQRTELSLSEIQHMRLLLDRALQPVADFNGFEWRDQYQTAAIRYQLNFLSYALSLAHAQYLPAFTGYLQQAQDNLLQKQQDYRIWRYWQWENLWGNLSTDKDPVIKDNIMFSGFVAAQILYARMPEQNLSFRYPDGRSYDYTTEQLVDVLVAQYEVAPFGLLPCEPNWIYPLCNLITATAIKALSPERWQTLQPGFLKALQTEFMTTDGRIVPFRSSYTGLAMPSVGGLGDSGVSLPFFKLFVAGKSHGTMGAGASIFSRQRLAQSGMAN